MLRKRGGIIDPCLPVALLLWAGAAVSLPGAQAALPALIGRITDGNQRLLAGVQVRVECAGAEVTAIGTDEQGLYRAELPGSTPCRVQATLLGFETAEKVLESLPAEGSAQLDFALTFRRNRISVAPAASVTTSGPASPANGSSSAGRSPARTAPLAPGTDRQQSFQNLPLEGVTADNDTAVGDTPQAMPVDFSDPAQSVPSEAFLINGSVNFGLQPGGPPGSGPDWSNDERIRALRDRLGLGTEPMADPFAGMENSQGGQMGVPRGAGAAGIPGGSAAGVKRQVAGILAAAAARKDGRGQIAGAPAIRARVNRIQGQVFGSLRNSALDARPYSLKGIEQKKPVYAQGRFGATVGGPLKLPFLAKDNKRAQPPMFLVNYNGHRGHTSYDATSTVPLAEERLGNFSGSLLPSGGVVRLYDPLTGGNGKPREPFPGNQIPANRLDPAAVGLLNFLPLPNLPGRVQNYYHQEARPTSADQLSARVNGRFTRSLNLSASYNLSQSVANIAGLFPSLKSQANTRTQSVELGNNFSFRRGLTSHFQFRFSRTRNLNSNPYSYRLNVHEILGIQGLSKEPINWGLPTILFTNYGDLRLANPLLRRQQAWTFSDNVRWVHGRHNWSFGFEFRHVTAALDTDENGRGSFVFSGFATSNIDADNNPLPRTGLDFADFLLGMPQNTARRYGENSVYLQSNVWSGFLVDDWRIRPDLSLNLGVRYEYAQPPVEKYDRISNVDLPYDLSQAAVVVPGQVGPYTGLYPRSLVDPDRNNIAPRIGLAYRPQFFRGTVLRAGYGIYYNLGIYEQVYPKLAQQPPFAVTQNLWASQDLSLSLRNGFPVAPDTRITNTFAVDRGYRVGYVQSWNLNLQKEVRRGWVMETAYLGSKGTKLDLLRAPNRTPPSGAKSSSNRLIENADTFIFETSGAASSYHALQLRVNRRLARGFSLIGSYTWSKSIDSASSIGGGGVLVAQDDHNLRAERGLSAFDVRHRLDLNYVFELPFGQGRKFLDQSGWSSYLLGGWTLSGLVSYNSGTPFTARILGNAINNSGSGGQMSERADATGEKVPLPGSERTQTRYFNTQAFTLPEPGTFGNASRNTIPGPSQTLVNLNITRDVRLDEKGRVLSLVWHISNLLNMPSYRSLGTVVNSSNFGRVTGVRPMRTMEATLRIRF